jgi:hypothetical protein
MNNNKRTLEVLGITIAVVACIATWLTVPQVQRLLGQSNPTSNIIQQPKTESVSVSQPTYTLFPTYTLYPTLIPPTQPDPTNVPAPTIEPTLLPLLVDSSLPGTPPGTVLQVGETWTTGGFSVQLVSLKFCCGDEADLQFLFTNNTRRAVFFHLNENSHVTMQDDIGKSYTWDYTYEEDIILENGDSWNEQVFKVGNFSGIKYLIVTLNLPNLIYAQWRYN